MYTSLALTSEAVCFFSFPPFVGLERLFPGPGLRTYFGWKSDFFLPFPPVVKHGREGGAVVNVFPFFL